MVSRRGPSDDGDRVKVGRGTWVDGGGTGKDADRVGRGGCDKGDRGEDRLL